MSAALGNLNVTRIVIAHRLSTVRDADRIIGLLEARGITEVRCIINRLRPDMVKRGDMLEVDDVLEILGIKLIGIVPEDEKIIISTNVGSPISLDNDKAGAGDAFRSIAGRIQGQDIPHAALESRTGLLSYLRKILGLR